MDKKVYEVEILNSEVYNAPDKFLVDPDDIASFIRQHMNYGTCSFSITERWLYKPTEAEDFFRH